MFGNVALDNPLVQALLGIGSSERPDLTDQSPVNSIKALSEILGFFSGRTETDEQGNKNITVTHPEEGDLFSEELMPVQQTQRLLSGEGSGMDAFDVGLEVLPEGLEFAGKGLLGALFKLPLPQIEEFVKRGAGQSQGILEGTADSMDLLKDRVRSIRGPEEAGRVVDKIERIGKVTESGTELGRDLYLKNLREEAMGHKTDDLIFPQFDRMHVAGTFHRPSNRTTRFGNPESVQPGGSAITLNRRAIDNKSSQHSLEGILRHELAHGASDTIPQEVANSVIERQFPWVESIFTPHLTGESALVEFLSELAQGVEGSGAVDFLKMSGLDPYIDVLEILDKYIPIAKR